MKIGSAGGGVVKKILDIPNFCVPPKLNPIQQKSYSLLSDLLAMGVGVGWERGNKKKGLKLLREQ